MLHVLLLWLFSVAPPGDHSENTHHEAARRPSYRTQFHIRRRFPRPRKKPVVQTASKPETQIIETESKPWNGYFAAKNFATETIQGARELASVKNVLRRSILALPKSHTSALKSLEVKNAYHKSRGLSNHEKIILHLDLIDTDKELSAVFFHEMGHIVDLGYLQGNSYYGRTTFKDRNQPIYRNDPSAKFYEISWRTTNLRRDNAIRSDFVSGYAMSNPFEDFAESYIFYRLHGDKFRTFAKSSLALQQKYNFLKDVVFDGKEFQTDTLIAKDILNTQYDTTVIDYDLSELKN